MLKTTPAKFTGNILGSGEKEVVVFLNGLAMLTKSWYRTVPFLHPDYDILLYDYFGQGQSSAEDEPYLINRFADYLIQVMDAAGVEKIHPIGVSYGGFIGAELGRLHQDRLHTLTLSGILLTRETLFQMYQDISLRFYHQPMRCSIFTPNICTRKRLAKISRARFMVRQWRRDASSFMIDTRIKNIA